MARYLIETADEEGSTQVEIKDHYLPRALFVERMRSQIDQYTLYNGLAITSLLNRLHMMVDADAAAELGEDLNLEDEDSEGVIKWT